MKMQGLACKLRILCIPVQCECERLQSLEGLGLMLNFKNWGGLKQGIQENEGVNYFKTSAAIFLLT